jgi:Spy/CpxP family protein refolding chaperone
MTSYLKKSLILASVAIAVSAPALRAEDAEKPAEHKGAGHGDHYAALNLTAEQQKQISAIEADAKTQMAALPKDDKEGKMKIRTDSQAKIRAILTPEQQAKFDEMNAKSKKPKKKSED